VLTGTPAEIQRGEKVLRAAKRVGPICISTIVYAEVASHFPSRQRADDFFALAQCRVDPVDETTAYLAARFFLEYRLRGGSRTRILPDFLIAAHAQLRADRILTRDKRFFKETFPKLKAVSPEDIV
jgi:predicted nucleic acid-binding protein